MVCRSLWMSCKASLGALLKLCPLRDLLLACLLIPPGGSERAQGSTPLPPSSRDMRMASMPLARMVSFLHMDMFLQ
jgi:hypothetical protein